MSIEGCLGRSLTIIGLGANNFVRPSGHFKMYGYLSTRPLRYPNGGIRIE
jgi:hypothetical protein